MASMCEALDSQGYAVRNNTNLAQTALTVPSIIYGLTRSVLAWALSH